MPERTAWTRDQLLMALRLYMRLPFGKLDWKNKEIIELAGKIGRSPGALAMKACNFASVDSKLNRRGLSNASQADRAIWQEFEGNPTKLALEAEEAAERLRIARPEDDLELQTPTGPTEKESLVQVRRVQSFFRAAVMISYEGRCAVTGLGVPALLVASHIIPWSVSVEQRADPRNGLYLNALFDRAFDRGLLTFDEDWRLVLSKRLRTDAQASQHGCSLLDAEGIKLRLPKRFQPAAEAIQYHREKVYCS